MAHYLTFDSSVTCKVNGVSVESGYELHDGDVIVAGTTSVNVEFLVNSDACTGLATVNVYDSDVAVSTRVIGSGGFSD